jgi:hypothetical protein
MRTENHWQTEEFENQFMADIREYVLMFGENPKEAEVRDWILDIYNIETSQQAKTKFIRRMMKRIWSEQKRYGMKVKAKEFYCVREVCCDDTIDRGV